MKEGRRKVIIMGAAGRDFHNFNTFFRNNTRYEVVCFTAEQIPNISGRAYPKELSGKLYPKGIHIFDEKHLHDLIKKHNVDEVVLAYSDLSHQEVMEKASIVLASGADFRLMCPKSTMLKSKKRVISICAVRTGAGKSPTTRKICKILKEMGIKPRIIRHPMPYGDLKKQTVQKFATIEDLKKHHCTIEEIEEYEPHINNGFVVYAGVDYAKILEEAEKEADVIVWDGGNNDVPFYKPDLHIVVADPHRPGDELTHYPGMVNVLLADVIIINKIDTAKKENVEMVKRNVKSISDAKIIMAKSSLSVDKPELVKGKNVLVVEDGPTLTHGNMHIGAAGFAIKKYNANPIDPRPYASGSITDIYKKHTHLGNVLPAMGYGKEQMRDLEKTINKAKCDSVVIGTPIDLNRYIKINKPTVKVTYKLEETGKPDLKSILDKFLKRLE